MLNKNHSLWAKLVDASLVKNNITDANAVAVKVPEANVTKANVTEAHITKAYGSKEDIQEASTQAESAQANAYQASVQKTAIAKGMLDKNTNPYINSVSAPWFVKILLALSGWLGALFLLGFLFAGFYSFIENPQVSFVLSLPLLIIAYKILQSPNNEFYEHLALALSLAGQALVFISVIEWPSEAVICFTLAVFQLVLVYFMPSFLHRVSSTIFAALLFAACLAFIGLPYLFTTLLIFPVVWLCVNEFTYSEHFQIINGLMVGLVLTLLFLQCSYVFDTSFENMLPFSYDVYYQIPYWVFNALYIAGLVFTTWQLLLANTITLNSKWGKMALFLTCVLGLATFKAPGIGVGVVVVVLGFAHSNRVLMGLGILSLIIYSSAYYYLMSETLLVKSAILLTVGVLMLVSRWLFNRFVVTKYFVLSQSKLSK